MFFIWWRQRSYIERILLLLGVGFLSWYLARFLLSLDNIFFLILSIPFFIIGVILLLPFVLGWWLFKGVMIVFIVSIIALIFYAFLLNLGINLFGK